MTTTNTPAALTERHVGEIAATLPGASAVFRAFRIDFCCHGNVPLAAAARERNLNVEAIVQALQALDTRGETAATATTLDSAALIERIRTRYHDAHRRSFPELISLSRKVEAVHRANPKVPRGLADLLEEMASELEDHMAREETTLFPAMQRVESGLAATIDELRHEHDDHGALLRQIETLTDDFTLPAGACRSWAALYTSTARLAEDLMEHIHLENNVLFPRFAAAAGAAA